MESNDFDSKAGYSLHLSVRNADGSDTDLGVVEAYGPPPAQNVVIEVTCGEKPQRYRIINIPFDPPVSHPQPSVYNRAVPWVIAREVPEFEILFTKGRATATDAMLGYVYEFVLRQHEPFVSVLGQKVEYQLRDAGNLKRATVAVLSAAREKALIPEI
jgi:hypothetical protein